MLIWRLWRWEWEFGADAAVAFDEIGLGHVVAMDEDDEVLAFLGLRRPDHVRDEGGAIDLVGWIWILLVWDLEEARGSGFAGERTAFDGTGADDVVGHVNRGGQGSGRTWIECKEQLSDRTQTESFRGIKRGR